MATRRSKSAKPPVEVQVVKGGRTLTAKPGEPFIEVKTGLTDNKKYLIKIKPSKGKATLIAVHL